MNDRQTLPPGWSIAQLGELGEWTGGGTPSKANAAFWANGTIPWVSAKDMKQFVISDSVDRITEDAVRRSAAKMIASESILFVMRSGILSHTFPVARTTVPVTVNQDLRALTPTAGVLPAYVAYGVRASGSEILRTMSKDGTTVASVDAPMLAAFELPLAPTVEQRRIVDTVESYFTRLEEAERLLERAKRNLERYRASVLKAAVEGRLVPTEAELARAKGTDYEPAATFLERIHENRRQEQSRSRTMNDRRIGRYRAPLTPGVIGHGALPEGWCWATIDQLAADVSYGTSAKTLPDAAAGVPVLRMGNLQAGSISYDSLKYLPATHDEFPELLLRDGDLLFNRTNSAELVGKSAVYQARLPRCSFASYLLRIRIVADVSPVYVGSFLNSLAGREWIASVVSQQVGQANVNSSKLRACVIPLPPRAEQQRIVSEVERLLAVSSRLSADLHSNENGCGRVRQSILRWAFEGRLVDQDPTDEPVSALLDRIRAEREAAVAKPANSRPRRKAKPKPSTP